MSRMPKADEGDVDLCRLFGDEPGDEQTGDVSMRSRVQLSAQGSSPQVLPGVPRQGVERGVGQVQTVTSQMYGTIVMPRVKKDDPAYRVRHPRCPACGSFKIRWFLKRSWGTRVSRWVYCMKCNEAYKEEEVLP